MVWNAPQQQKLVGQILQGNLSVEKASQIFGIPQTTIQQWAEAALPEIPSDSSVPQAEPASPVQTTPAELSMPAATISLQQLAALQAAYGEAMLEIRMLKKELQELKQIIMFYEGHKP